MKVFLHFYTLFSQYELISRIKYISIMGILLFGSLSIPACRLVDDIESDLPHPDVLFQDDFSDPSSGWNRAHTKESITDYENGIFRIYIHGKNSDYWANPKLNFTDVIINVETKKVGGSDDNHFGVLCRYQDTENFYFFFISSDGYYGVGKLKDQQQMLLSDRNLLPSEEINQGEATNHIQASCIGNMLTLYVNDHELSSIEDSDFSSGDVGLIAGTDDLSGTDIHFDNFKVLKP